MVRGMEIRCIVPTEEGGADDSPPSPYAPRQYGGRMMAPPLRLTRALVDRLPARVDERGPVRISAPDPDYYETTAARIISEIDSTGELWVFAIGSLIWNPRCDVVERRPALVKGWQRSFCYGPEMRMRGSPSAPGRMLSLDCGGVCRGLALRMAPENLTTALIALLKQEPPFPPEWIEVETENGTFPAIAFTAFRGVYFYSQEPPIEELADILASSVGHIGSMADYLLNTVTHLEAAGIHDPHLWHLQELVAERLERLG